MTDIELQFENFQALSFVQSALGAVTPNFRALSIACSNSAVDLYFTLERDSAEDREEIDVIVTEMYSHQFSGEVLIRSHIKVTAGPRNFKEMVTGRAIYLRHES